LRSTSIQECVNRLKKYRTELKELEIGSSISKRWWRSSV